MEIRILACMLLPISVALQHQPEPTRSDDTQDTCSSEQLPMCETQSSSGLLPREHDAMKLWGRVPHRLSVINTSGIHVSVKTAAKYHEERLSLLMLTWLQILEPHQVHIVTDDIPEDSWIATAENYGFNVTTATGCPVGHKMKCLCCKSGVEFEQFYLELERGANYKWFCHVDDDMYVNVPQLVTLLQSYNPVKDHLYLGRWSLSRTSKLELDHTRIKNIPNLKSTQFAFGTGALYCISLLLMTELEPYLRGAQRFLSTCQLLQYPDDMTIGATIEAILGYNFTDVDTIYSQLNGLNNIPPSKLPQAISISYGESILPGGEIKKRRVNIHNAQFTIEEDPTRFLSYHCLIHPGTSWCK